MSSPAKASWFPKVGHEVEAEATVAYTQCLHFIWLCRCQVRAGWSPWGQVHTRASTPRRSPTGEGTRAGRTLEQPTPGDSGNAPVS